MTNSPPLWTEGNTLNKPLSDDYCPNVNVKEWTYHTITVDSRSYNFFRNGKTGLVKSPGVVDFTSDSLEDAKTKLFEVYHND